MEAKARPCEQCGGPMPLTARTHASVCGPTCRKRRQRARQRAAGPTVALPRALTRQPRWVRRSAAKVPLTTTGDVASATDPATWATYEAAVAATVGTGLGLVLVGDGVVCVDLDHCLDAAGQPTPAVDAWLSTLPPTYVEISPSGDGLHVWGRGLVLTARKIRADGIAGEVIGARKYATITGRRFRNAPLTLATISAQAGALIY